MNMYILFYLSKQLAIVAFVEQRSLRKINGLMKSAFFILHFVIMQEYLLNRKTSFYTLEIELSAMTKSKTNKAVEANEDKESEIRLVAESTSHKNDHQCQKRLLDCKLSSNEQEQSTPSRFTIRVSHLHIACICKLLLYYFCYICDKRSFFRKQTKPPCLYPILNRNKYYLSLTTFLSSFFHYFL